MNELVHRTVGTNGISWGIFEYTRQLAEAAEQRRKPPPLKTVSARGSIEWLAEQDKARSIAPSPVPNTPPDIE